MPQGNAGTIDGFPHDGVGRAGVSGHVHAGSQSPREKRHTRGAAEWAS